MPGSALTSPDAGVRFGLSDKTFEAWWNSALLPEDADEFVHLYGGNKLGARFVCALDYLTATAQERPEQDVIVRAYCLAKKLDESRSLDETIRIEAGYLYADPPVEALLERLRYREQNNALGRVAKLTLSAIEKKLREAPDKDDIKAGVSLMNLEQRERNAREQRRDNRAVREAMAASRKAMRDASQPPSLDEFRHSIVMAIELFGMQTVREVILSALPIDGAADTTATTIESE